MHLSTIYFDSNRHWYFRFTPTRTPTPTHIGYQELLARVATPAKPYLLPEYVEEVARIQAQEVFSAELSTPRVRYDPRVLMYVDDSAEEDNLFSP